jgi:hypothetical protein
MINDNHTHDHIRNNHSITIIDESHEQQRQGSGYVLEEKVKFEFYF